MKKFGLVAVLAILASPALAGAVKYPAGASAAAIAANEQVRAEIAGKPGIVHCALIDTRDKNGKCLVLSVLDAGGGGDGGGAGAGGE